MDEIPNVNNLNGIPNFGHGLPEDGVVAAGITDTVDVVDVPEEVEDVVPTKKKAPVAE